jgi:catechol 2,3-dioxygenase-like lactoylglutathione lyase family enzyme
MTTATVRYFVDDLDEGVAFYRDELGFEVELRPSPMFAMLYRGDLRVLLSVPGGGGGGAPMPDGTQQGAGGWNRFALEVPDLEASVAQLRGRGARFRNDIVTGVGVKQILLQDPAGNLVELFEPLAAYHDRRQPTSG